MELQKDGASKTFLDILSLFISIFAILVPVLYVFGRVNREAYFAELNLPSGMMQYSVEDYIYSGFGAVIGSLFRWISALPFGPIVSWFLLLLALAVLLAVLVSMRGWIGWLSSRVSRVLEEKLRHFSSNKGGFAYQWARPLFVIAQWVNAAFLAFLVPLFLVGIGMLWASHSGKHDAKRVSHFARQSGQVGAYDRRPIAHLVGESVSQSGVLLECSDAWCVLSRRGDFIVVKQEDIFLVDHCPETIRHKNGAVSCDAESLVTP